MSVKKQAKNAFSNILVMVDSYAYRSGVINMTKDDQDLLHILKELFLNRRINNAISLVNSKLQQF